MMPRLLLTLLIALALTSTVAAEDLPDSCPVRPVDEESATALAGTWFNKGSKLAEEHRYVDALKAFNCSLRMVEHPDTIFNAAQAARLASQRETAIEMLARYLAVAPEGAMVDEARKLVETLLQEGEDEKEQERQEQLQREEEARQEAEEQRRKEAEAREETEDASENAKELKTAGYVLIGVGGAGLITGAALQILAAKAANDSEEFGIDYERWKELDGDREGYQIGAIVGFSVGGAALITGITLAVIGHKKEKEPAVSFVPTPGGFGISGSF
jgi:tetratricopeptide (TPR) repeat protein